MPAPGGNGVVSIIIGDRLIDDDGLYHRQASVPELKK
jgi:hypothetical protein